MSNTKSKFDTISLVICAVLLVAVILAIVGVCVNYVTHITTVGNLTTSTSYKLSAKYLSEFSGYGAMAAFAYITLVLAIVTLALYVVTKFVDIKAVKLATFVVSALLVICAIVALITAYTFGGKVNFGAGAGAWLLAIGGIIGGAAGIVGTYTVLKK